MYNTQSINERLRVFAKDHDIANVERARVILCLERAIARLMQDKYLCSKLIFGGGFVLYKSINSLRFTTDVDAIISGLEKEELISKITKALEIDLKDGFWFGKPRVSALAITSGYGGFRFKIPYKAGLPFPQKIELLKLRSVQLDVSVGVDLEAFAIREVMESTLNIFSNVEWAIYPLEFICAEKIHTLYSKGDLNTRGKDIYDLSLLLPKVGKRKLMSAIKKTFENRKDSISDIYVKVSIIDTAYLEKNYSKIFPDYSKGKFKEKWQMIVNALKGLKDE